jgi:hypothetical protein
MHDALRSKPHPGILGGVRKRIAAKRVLMVASTLAVLAAAGAVAVMGPRNVIGMLRYDTRHEGALKVGDRAPDVIILTVDGAPAHFVDRLGARPTVLILGSFT